MRVIQSLWGIYAVMIANMPNRKGLTIAINYLVDRPGCDEASV